MGCLFYFILFCVDGSIEGGELLSSAFVAAFVAHRVERRARDVLGDVAPDHEEALGRVGGVPLRFKGGQVAVEGVGVDDLAVGRAVGRGRPRVPAGMGGWGGWG